MITEAICDFVLFPFRLIMDMLPDISWTVNAESFTVLFEFFEVICYMLPMKTVVFILSSIVVINAFKVTVSIIKTIWQLLPFL